jgi:nitroreductase
MATPTAPTHELGAIEAIHRRRAVRNYQSTPLDEDTVRQLLDAAVHAPTAMHLEPWAFVVVQDKDVLRHVSDRAKQVMR